MYQARDDKEQAHNAFARAAEMVQLLSNKIEGEQLRKTFLSSVAARVR